MDGRERFNLASISLMRMFLNVIISVKCEPEVCTLSVNDLLFYLPFLSTDDETDLSAHWDKGKLE